MIVRNPVDSLRSKTFVGKQRVLWTSDSLRVDGINPAQGIRKLCDGAAEGDFLFLGGRKLKIVAQTDKQNSKSCRELHDETHPLAN